MSNSFDFGAANNDDPDAVALDLDAKREKPRLKIEHSHPERTVANLRDILAASSRLYDRGTPVASHTIICSPARSRTVSRPTA